MLRNERREIEIMCLFKHQIGRKCALDPPSNWWNIRYKIYDDARSNVCLEFYLNKIRNKTGALITWKSVIKYSWLWVFSVIVFFFRSRKFACVWFIFYAFGSQWLWMSQFLSSVHSQIMCIFSFPYFFVCEFYLTYWRDRAIRRSHLCENPIEPL